ncbi:ABC transporter permease [Paenibacillus sabuli]|nr:ABC transporter permease subunit [Paenibacillus sabuli]
MAERQAVGGGAVRMPQRRNRRRLRQNIPYFILFTPIIVYFLLFKYAPMGGLVIAFKDYNFADGVFGSPWVGLGQFETLFSNPQTLRIIRNTFVLSVLALLIGFPFPILLAVLLNEVGRVWFKRGVQTLVYLPHFLSWVIVSGIVITIFSIEGVINNLFADWLGWSPIQFLYSEGSWLALFIGSGIWKGAGWGAIIYLAALSSIDPSLYESASIDGANKWKQIRHITLPGIAPTIVIVFILSVGNVMEVGFDQVYTLQNSAVFGISEVISTYTYKIGLQSLQFSLTSAMGLFESLIGLVLVLITNTIARRYGQGLW